MGKRSNMGKRSKRYKGGRYKGGTKSKSKSKSKSTSNSTVTLRKYKELEDENKRLTEMYIKLEAELDRCKQTIKTMKSFLNLK